MRPPKLAWFERNGAYQTTGYVNHIDKIDEINLIIDSFNLQNGHTHVPGFQSEGCRPGGSIRNAEGVVTRSMTKHQMSAWREYERGPEHCLHLAESGRVVLCQKVVKYLALRVLRVDDNNNNPNN